jgi:radical SAM superfamily enzyme YgiQ (UPF0313 family)
MIKETILLYNPSPESQRKTRDVPLSLLCASKVLNKEGYKVKIVADNLYDNHMDIIRETAKNSRVLGISSLTGYQILGGLEACRVAKQANKDIKIIWGGYHPSIFPAQTLENPYVDIVVKGKGEKAFYEVIKKLDEDGCFNDMPGIHWKKDGQIFSNPDRPLEKMEGSPPIPYHLVDVEKCLYPSEYGKRTISYVSSYGCPYKCGFCCEVSVYDQRWVGLDAKSVVDDIERLEKEYKVDAIGFYDSLFFTNINRSKAIFREMLNRGVKVRLGNLDGRSKQLADADDELWELMQETRTYSIFCGAESGDDETLKAMTKEIVVEDNYRFANRCHKYGIKVVFGSMVGLPLVNHSIKELTQKTDDQIESNIQMFDAILSKDKRHRAQIFIYCPYPGTSMYEDSIRLGFKEPKSLAEWGKITYFERPVPWVNKNQGHLVPMISNYIFMFLDSDTIVWTKEKIKNKIFQAIFICFFKTASFIARLRWKYKFFKIPIDYKLFTFAKSINRWI